MNRFVSNRKCLVFCLCLTFVLFTNARCIAHPKELDNAALLYYRALMVWPKPDHDTAFRNVDETVEHAFSPLGHSTSPASKVSILVLDDVIKGADPNENVKKYLAMPESQTAIGLFKQATQIRPCNWGPLQQWRSGVHQFTVSLIQFTRIIQVFAHNLAAEGDFRSALETCIGIQQYAGHIGSDTYLMFATSRAINHRAFISIRHILGSMPVDAETLTWLKGQLILSKVSPSLCVGILKSDFSLNLQYVRDNQDVPLSSLPLENFPGEIEDVNAREEFLKNASEGHNKDMESALKILNSSLPYARKYEEIQKLTNDNRIQSCYHLMVMDTANFNALTVALEIYLIKARTGRIPQILPDNLAKDPFSDTDFEYKVTDEGFALRYRNGRWLEFKVRR